MVEPKDVTRTDEKTTEDEESLKDFVETDGSTTC